MPPHNKTLHLIASKFGLGEHERVLGKAAEFERLLQTKSMAGSNITDTGKVAICLDLAAGLLGADLDLKTAIKYSGLKPAMYTNCRKMVQNLLDLNTERLTTPVLCAALQCTGVQDLADKILDAYMKQAKMEIDLNLPQYVCMAVYHACRVNKVKIPKTKILEKSRLKPAQWNKLDEDWTKFVDQNFTGTKKKRGRPPKNSTELAAPEEMELDQQHQEESEPQIEAYEDWKRRMLEGAYAELKDLERKNAKENETRRECNVKNSAKENEVIAKDMRTAPRKLGKEMVMDFQNTPRRSPRKTPQKFSPYKTPTKGNGVRLLFSLD